MTQVENNTENATDFEMDDVVRFKGGERLMNIFGDRVTIDTMFVERVDEDGMVGVTDHPYHFTFSPDELVRVGNKYDTEYVDGDEVYTWLPELNDDLHDPEDDD